MILESLITLFLLILLQAVLGFDNLLYISLESKRAPVEKRKAVRNWGIGIAIVLRIVLLIALLNLIKYFENPLFNYGGVETSHAMDVSSEPHEGEVIADTGPHTEHSEKTASGRTDYKRPGDAMGNKSFWMRIAPNVHSLIVLLGGAFIIYTATKEVMHMMRIELDHSDDEKPRKVASIVFWIVLMNVVFSFDSILSAMALTSTVWVMATAIVISGILMMVLSDHVSSFLQKNRMYEVLGLFILFVVGIMLLTEGAHLAHLEFFGNKIMPMSKTTFYFVIGVLVVTDIVQSRYQRKLLAESAAGRA
jgi:predicted tellurium resistance membrane protein TerC